MFSELVVMILREEWFSSSLYQAYFTLSVTIRDYTTLKLMQRVLRKHSLYPFNPTIDNHYIVTYKL